MIRACEVLHAAKLSDTVWGFVATRDRLGRGMWVTPNGVGLDEVRARDVVLVNFAGDVIVGSAQPDQESALALEVMRIRHDVHAVVHAHSLHATAFGVNGRELEALSHEGCHLVPNVVRGTFTGDDGAASAEGRTFAVGLGQRNVSFVAGHGFASAAATLGEAVALAVYLERACRLQLIVGEPGHVVSDVDVMEKRSGQVNRPRISWEYLRRVTPQRVTS